MAAMRIEKHHKRGKSRQEQQGNQRNGIPGPPLFYRDRPYAGTEKRQIRQYNRNIQQRSGDIPCILHFDVRQRGNQRIGDQDRRAVEDTEQIGIADKQK